MSNPFLAELRLVGFNFAPKGWAFAAGQLLPISQNTAVFALVGTYYGGNGTSNFALPNLQGNVAIGQGQSTFGTLYDIGQQGGEQAVTLLATEVPAHSHTVRCDVTPANQSSPDNNSFAHSTSANLYTKNTSPTVNMNQNAIPPAGGSLPHNNMMSYLALNWIIALQGVFPQRP